MLEQFISAGNRINGIPNRTHLKRIRELQTRVDCALGQYFIFCTFKKLTLIHFLLVHDIPSPVNASLHLQENPPPWFVHVPFTLQLCLLDKHSSISGEYMGLLNETVSVAFLLFVNLQRAL